MIDKFLEQRMEMVDQKLKHLVDDLWPSPTYHSLYTEYRALGYTHDIADTKAKERIE